MTDALSDVFRANVLRLMDERDTTPYRLSKAMGADAMLVRTQIIARRGRYGVTLATVERYAEALEVDPLELLTPAPSRSVRLA